MELCPVEKCSFTAGFKSMQLLKQHYMKTHNQYICPKCKKKSFKTKDAAREHEASCGQMFDCSCGIAYSTLRSLRRHAEKQGHQVPQKYLNQVHKTDTKKKKVKKFSHLIQDKGNISSRVLLPKTLKNQKRCIRVFKNVSKYYRVVCPSNGAQQDIPAIHV